MIHNVTFLIFRCLNIHEGREPFLFIFCTFLFMLCLTLDMPNTECTEADSGGSKMHPVVAGPFKSTGQSNRFSGLCNLIDLAVYTRHRFQLLM